MHYEINMLRVNYQVQPCLLLWWTHMILWWRRKRDEKLGTNGHGEENSCTS